MKSMNGFKEQASDVFDWNWDLFQWKKRSMNLEGENCPGWYSLNENITMNSDSCYYTCTKFDLFRFCVWYHIGFYLLFPTKKSTSAPSWNTCSVQVSYLCHQHEIGPTVPTIMINAFYIFTQFLELLQRIGTSYHWPWHRSNALKVVSKTDLWILLVKRSKVT